MKITKARKEDYGPNSFHDKPYDISVIVEEHDENPQKTYTSKEGTNDV